MKLKSFVTFFILVSKPGQVERDSRDAVEQEDGGPNQCKGNRRPELEAFHASRRQTRGDVQEREQRSVRVREREHEPPHFVSNIDIPADLEAMQRFKRAA